MPRAGEECVCEDAASALRSDGRRRKAGDDPGEKRKARVPHSGIGLASATHKNEAGLREIHEIRREWKKPWRQGLAGLWSEGTRESVVARLILFRLVRPGDGSGLCFTKRTWVPRGGEPGCE